MAWIEHVLATQTLPQSKPKTMAINVEGTLKPGVTSKDIILAIIAQIGTGGGQGFVLEYRGSAIRALSMEARMTICNMSIEAGARAGLIAPDEKTFEYLKSKPHAPQGADWEAAVEYWKTLHSDSDAKFDHEITGSATKKVPASAFRESITGEAVVVAVGLSECSAPPVTRAISSKVSVIMRAALSLVPVRFDHRMDT